MSTLESIASAVASTACACIEGAAPTTTVTVSLAPPVQDAPINDGPRSPATA